MINHTGLLNGRHCPIFHVSMNRPGELRPRNGFAFNTTATDYLNAHVILVFSCIILLKLSDISFLNQLPGPQREGGRLSNRGVGVGFWLVLYTVRVSEREVPTAEYVERKSIFSLVCLANEIHFLPTCTSATARCLFFTPRASRTSASSCHQRLNY